jgi:hypothetical protein
MQSTHGHSTGHSEALLLVTPEHKLSETTAMNTMNTNRFILQGMTN